MFDKTMVAALSTLIVACSEPEATATVVDNLPPGSLATAEAPDGACGTFGEIPVVSGISAEALDTLYASIDFDLDAVRTSAMAVPPIMLADIPSDLHEVKSVEQRKKLFLRAVLPAITFVNQRLLEQRRFLERIRAAQARNVAMSAAQRNRLARLATCYGVASDDIDSLLRRIDVVPAGLGLAQAAVESAWGTSRFARTGNAILGQRTYGGDGIVPAGLDNPSFRVHSFDHILACVAAYAYNLNTHPAYEAFRAKRAATRREGKPPDSHILAGTLVRYSERGKAYVRELRTIIRSNRLRELDGARPDPVPTVTSTDATAPS